MAARKTPAKKTPAKKTPTMTPNGLPLRGSAGPRILQDLGLTDAELAAFLPSDAPPRVRWVFWCQFEGPGSLDAIAAHFEPRFPVTRAIAVKYPGNGRPEISVPGVTLATTGRYVSYTFYGMRGDTYCEDGSWQLEVAFRESGTSWGSNRAVYERFKAIELASLGARGIIERTE